MAIVTIRDGIRKVWKQINYVEFGGILPFWGKSLNACVECGPMRSSITFHRATYCVVVGR